MNEKLSKIFKIVGAVVILGVVAYDNLLENPNTTVYWVMMGVGVALVIAGRIIASIGSGGDSDDEDY